MTTIRAILVMLTAQQVSEIIDRPPSTTRFWATTYREYLPRKKNGRFYVYPEEAVSVFKKITELTGRGLYKEQIKDELQKSFGTYEDGETVEDKEPPTDNAIVVQKQYLEMTAFFTAMMSKYDELIAVQREELAILKKLVLTKEVKPKTTPKKVAPKKKTVKRAVKKTPKKPAKKKASGGARIGKAIGSFFSEPFK